MSFRWAQEAELCLACASAAAGLFDDKALRRPVRTKESARDLVTALDLSSERAIRERLAGSSYPIVGEELAPNTPPDASLPTWFVDPLDGTANFVSHLPFYCSSVGLLCGREFAVGAVVAPALRELFFVSDCGEAYLNGSRLCPVDATLDESLVGMAFSSRKTESSLRGEEFALFGELNDAGRGCLRTGSAALNVCYVAAGRLQAAVGIQNRLWDVAGALAVARAAGFALRMRIDWAACRVTYVAGCPSAVDAIAPEVQARLNIALT